MLVDGDFEARALAFRRSTTEPQFQRLNHLLYMMTPLPRLLRAAMAFLPALCVTYLSADEK